MLGQRTSIVRKFINYGCKKFYNIGTWCAPVHQLANHSLVLLSLSFSPFLFRPLPSSSLWSWCVCLVDASVWKWPVLMGESCGSGRLWSQLGMVRKEWCYSPWFGLLLYVLAGSTQQIFVSKFLFRFSFWRHLVNKLEQSILCLHKYLCQLASSYSFQIYG